MEEIKITLETLYDILRNEKQREDLQQLNDTFFVDVVSYLKEKKKLLESKQDEDDLFAAGEREKLEYELRSIKRILKEVYEKREKKIIDIAMNKSRTGSDIIDTSALLQEEKEFYDLLLGLLDGYRKGVLLNLFRGEIPFVQVGKIQVGKLPPKMPELSETKKEPLEPVVNEPLNPTPMEEELEPTLSTKQSVTETPTSTESEKKSTETSPPEQLPTKPETPPSEQPLTESKENNSQSIMKKIKFIHPVPSFVWTDLKDYGPWEAGEETEMFVEVADLMIEKKRAVEV